MKKKSKKQEPKPKRYFATCTYCKKKYESDEPIKPCCNGIVYNDRLKLKSYYVRKK